jgi:2-polyprenyl-3-methyl-5-hydroxy-6-metoxy-1,4-benzoquinol methylase
MDELNSLERIVPEQESDLDNFDRSSLKLHQDRYGFAIQNGKPGRVLDIACGTGYGAHQMIHSLRLNASHIVAVDISAQSIRYAKEHYSDPSIEFICSDALQFTDEQGFDTIVSLETIEHLQNPRAFVGNLYGLLKKSGVLIISAPVTPSTDGNPYHLSDFTSSGFKKLLLDFGFEIQNELLQIQPYSILEILYSNNTRLTQTRRGLGKYYLQNPGKLFARIGSIIKDGFNNKYLCLVLHKK